MIDPIEQRDIDKLLKMLKLPEVQKAIAEVIIMQTTEDLIATELAKYFEEQKKTEE